MASHTTLTATLERHSQYGYLPWNTFLGSVETVDSFLARPEVDGAAHVTAQDTNREIKVRPASGDYVIVNLVKAPVREHSWICNCSNCCPRDVEINVETRG